MKDLETVQNLRNLEKLDTFNTVFFLKSISSQVWWLQPVIPAL